MELLDQYEKASQWTATLVRGASDKLDAPTPCEGWDARTLINHMIDTQQFFAAKARGQDAPFPNPNPPDLGGDDPVAAFDKQRADTLRAFAEPDAAEKLGMGVAAAFGDALLHGWDLATATGQDTTMPTGLAEKAYEAIHGNFTDENRKWIFGPEVTVADDASPQAKLLAYSGRTPA